MGIRSEQGRAHDGSRRRLAAISTLAALLFPGIGAAEPVSAGAGVFLGYAFGKDAGFQWGFEAFATFSLETGSLCTADPRRYGVGPLAQVAFVGLSPPAFTLAGQGGGEIDERSVALTGELGATYQVGRPDGFGIHAGFRSEAGPVNLYLRGDPIWAQASLNGGLRFLPTYGIGQCVAGRPLRLDDGAPAPLTAARRVPGSPRRSRKDRWSDASFGDSSFG